MSTTLDYALFRKITNIAECSASTISTEIREAVREYIKQRQWMLEPELPFASQT